MVSSSSYQTSRTAEYAARDLLHTQGYVVIRVTERHSKIPVPFQLIAWRSEKDILLISVRSPRHSEEVLNDLMFLTAFVKSRSYPGEMQYWVRERSKWKRYRIFPGGAVQISDGELCIL
jgi:hypothetical protein